MKALKKVFQICLLLTIIILCSSCKQSPIKKHSHTMCEICNKCTSLSCSSKEKCEGHLHSHTECEICGKCIDSTCPLEEDKCEGHLHSHTICETCNKCTDSSCPDNDSCTCNQGWLPWI